MLEKIDSFGFPEGETIGWKYEVLSRLGSGWEAEVYLLREIETGIERAGEFFFPHRNVKSKASRFYDKKLHKLRHCPTIIQYYTQETIYIEGNPVQFLVSDYVDGPILEDFIKGQPGSRQNTVGSNNKTATNNEQQRMRQRKQQKTAAHKKRKQNHPGGLTVF